MSRRRELLERAGAQGLLQDCGTAREVNQALNGLLPQRAEITGIGLDGTINAWVPSSAIPQAARVLAERALKFAARKMDLRVPPQRLLNRATGGPLFSLSSMYPSQRGDWIQWRAAARDFAGGPGEICQNQGIPPEHLVTVKAKARDLLLREQFGKKSRIPPAAAVFIDDEPPDPRSFITVRDYPGVGGFGFFPVNPSKERYQDEMSAWYTLQQIRAWKEQIQF